MELIDRKELAKLVPYSRAHIQRMEDDKRFPRRVQLNPGIGRCSRVAWVKQEVLDWIEERVKAREPANDNDDRS